MRLGAKDPATSIRPHLPVDPASPPAVHSHLRKMELLRRFARQRGGMAPDRLLPAISISDSCCDTGACAAHCPTQALIRWQGETAQGLSFDPHHCIDCGLCVQACPDKALSFDHAPSQSDSAARFILTSHPLGRCRQCGVEGSDNDADGHCPRCRNGVGMLRALFNRPAEFSLQARKPQERECHEHA